VGLVLGLDVPERFKVELLGLTKSNEVVNELLKALEDSDWGVRRKAAEALGKIGSETAIAGLLKALEDSYWGVRGNAAEALGKIGSETAMTELIKCLKNPAFVTLNNGDTLSQARKALDTIQNKLKYYHPIPESIKSSLESTSNPESKYHIQAENVQIIEQGHGTIQVNPNSATKQIE
jgi:vesicle coat complex subunit